MSPLYKQIEVSGEEKARKDRERQERRIERDLKERRLSSQQAELSKKEDQMIEAKKSIDAQNLRDDQSIGTIEARKRSREARERRDREREEQERLAKLRREQEAQEAKARREQQERWRQQQEAQAKIWREQEEQRMRAAAQKAMDLAKAQAEAARQEETARSQRRRRDNLYFNLGGAGSTRQSYTAACDHGGWWDKVRQRTACPKCHDVWTYLLQCPGCQTKACPKCQSDMRPRFQRHQGRTSHRETRRQRSPSPYHYDPPDWYD